MIRVDKREKKLFKISKRASFPIFFCNLKKGYFLTFHLQLTEHFNISTL